MYAATAVLPGWKITVAGVVSRTKQNGLLYRGFCTKCFTFLLIWIKVLDTQ